MDYGDVKSLFKPVYNRIDHHRLDELPGLGDADAANLARWLCAGVTAALPPLDRIDLFETPGTRVSLCWGKLGPALPA